MQGSILVPLDGSIFAEHALPHAISLSRRSGAPIKLLHVFVPVPQVYMSPTPPAAGLASTAEARIRMARYLSGVAEVVSRLTGGAVETEIRTGHAARGVIAAARESETALVVLTSHGRSGLARAWIGNVADAVVRSARTPVLVIRPQEEVARLGNEPRIEKILVPLDGSRFAEQALPMALQIGELTGASYTLLSIAERGVDVGYFPVPRTAHVDPDAVEVHTHEYLQDVARLLGPAPVDIVTRTRAPTKTASAILAEAEACGAQLIVMATHGRGGFRRAFLGSVADKVLRGAAIPVLLYRPRRASASMREELEQLETSAVA